MNREERLKGVRLLHTEFKQSNFQRIIIQRLIGQGFISKNAR